MRNRQQQKQVLDKPNLHPEKKSSSSSPSSKPVAAPAKDPDDFEDAIVDAAPPASVEIGAAGGSGGSAAEAGHGSVVVQGGSDQGDAEARVRRDKIKEVRKKEGVEN